MQKDRKKILVIDVGSGSIGLALVLVGQKNSIDFSNRYEIEYTDKVDFAILIEKMMATIKSSLAQLPKTSIDEVKVFFHSPWHNVHTKTVSIKAEKSFLLTESILNKASNEQILSFINKDSINNYHNLKIIESVIPEIKLNGYVTKDPFNKKVTNYEFLLSLALAPEDIISSITDICSKNLIINRKNISFHSATMAFAHLCGSLYNQNSNIMVIDVGAELTEISLVKNKVLSSGISFAQGTHDIVRNVSKSLDISFTDALSKTHASFSNVLSKDLSEKINETLKPNETIWQRSISESFAKILSIETVPQSIVLICEDSNLAPWYINTLKSDTFTQYLKTEGRFKIISPNTDALKNNLNINNNSYIDTSLGLLCITI